MKVAFVLGVFPTISETFIVNQIVALIDKGVDVKIFAFNKGDLEKVHEVILRYSLLDKVTYYNKVPKNKIKRVLQVLKFIVLNIFKFDFSNLFRSFNFFRYEKKALNLEQFYKSQWFLLKHHFDVVHVHFGPIAVPIVELEAEGYLKKSKLIVSFHGYDVDPSKIQHFKFLYKQLFERVTAITVNTEYTKNLVLRINSNITNINVLPVGLDTNLFKMEKTFNNDGKFRILYCGRLINWKGADLTIKIIVELIIRGHQNIELSIVGEGMMYNELSTMINNLKLNKVVFLKGAMKQNEIIELLNSSNVFLLPGIRDVKTGRCENQGLVIQEAQAMELPVVVSDVGGMKYGLLPNESGFVVKEKDIQGFADKIEFLIKNPDKAKKMGKRGRKFVVANYESKVLVKQLLEIYEGSI